MAEAEGQFIGSICWLQNEEHQGSEVVMIGEIKSKISKIVLSLAMTMFQCRCKWRLINYKIMALYLH
jgi:hypothetical protein